MFKKLMFITLLLLTTNANAAKQYYYFNKLPNLIKASCDGSPFTCSGGESGGETPGEEVDLSKLSISVSSELMLEKDSSSKALPVSLSISDGDISGVTLSVVKKEDISSIISAVSVSDNDGSDREISVSKASGGVLGRATITITATSGSTSKSVDVSVFTAGNCPLAKSIDTI
ncbi:MAG: hypothetical protein OIF36_00885, partial [Alphaproteobacteria bacterium]|nr:hypothetical protein [Alphaproteobacteria bacterium]